jgi:hypothetical protein
MGASSDKDHGAAASRPTQADSAHEGNAEIGWLTFRMWNQPGFVLTGSRIAGP